MSSSESSPRSEQSIALSHKVPIKFERDIIAVVETNVDDITGELVSRTIDKLISEGAFDVSVYDYLGKKGRSGQTVRAVCAREDAEKIAQVLVQETGTLGVKTIEYTRLIVPRREISVPVSIDGFKGYVKVKVAEVNGRMRIKPELNDAKQISDSKKIPLKDVMDLISVLARQFLSEENQREEKQGEGSNTGYDRG